MYLWKLDSIRSLDKIVELFALKIPPTPTQKLKIMYSTPMMFPLDLDGKLHQIQDENGKTIGTGSRQVCEVLLHLIAKPISPPEASGFHIPPPHPNVRSAIAV